MKKLCLLLVMLVFISGCSRFNTIDIVTYGYNRSPWRVTLIVEGQKVHTFAPNATESFVLQVLAPKSTSYSTTLEPSNRQTQISYSFLNEGTGVMTETRTCYVGERMKTTITYESAYTSSGGSSQPYINCYSSY